MHSQLIFLRCHAHLDYYINRSQNCSKENDPGSQSENVPFYSWVAFLFCAALVKDVDNDGKDDNDNAIKNPLEVQRKLTDIQLTVNLLLDE